MKGIVFNLLEDAVQRNFGAEAWDDLLDDAKVQGAYTSLGNYSDEEIVALVQAAAFKLGKTPAEILRWFGETAMPIMKERYPVFFENHTSSRAFILSVNNMIHPEVRKLYSGASCPFFHFRESADGCVTMAYQSSRKMCDLAHGFVKGASKIFCEEVEIEHQSCMNEGAERCVMDIRWHH